MRREVDKINNSCHARPRRERQEERLNRTKLANAIRNRAERERTIGHFEGVKEAKTHRGPLQLTGGLKQLKRVSG